TTYQYMNVFVPERATQDSPIFLRTYVGGYMASKATYPQAGDASGRALKEGYVVVIPGSRGRNSTIKKKKKEVFTGRAPKAILDLKAAIRYLRYFDDVMLGDAEKIITDGTSAGGAMSALMGATGNNIAYEEMLKEMGAADARDDVYAAVCFCPIIDLEHADMAYEWLYSCTNGKERKLTNEQLAVSKELAALYPDYLNGLKLEPRYGLVLNADNYMDYLKGLLIESAQKAKNAGADIPDTIGLKFSTNDMPGGMMPPVNGGATKGMPSGFAQKRDAGGRRPGVVPPFAKRQQGEYIVDIDMPTYLNYVVKTIALKTPPAFDAMGVAGANATGENEEFGNEKGTSVNFTAYSAAKNNTTLDDDLLNNVYLMNPMNFIGTDNTIVAPHWYIRHGARDRDTAFSVPVNLALKLRNDGKDVNFCLAWNRGHSGDYALDELFDWLKSILNN
nr:alpha/beta hydrolase [Prevotella sp.]